MRKLLSAFLVFVMTTTLAVAANSMWYPSGDKAIFVVPGVDEVCNSAGSLCTPFGAGGGDVTSSANITDNSITRGDGGVKGIQDSGVIIDDSDNISGVNDFTLSGDFATPYENTITVAQSGGDYDTIQAAINASVSGDTILIYDGTYTENITTKAGAMTTLVGVGTMGSVIIETNTGTALTVPSAMMTMAFVKNLKFKSTATGNNASKLFYGEGTMTTFKDVSFDYNVSDGYTEEIIDLEAGNYVFSNCRFDYDSTGTNGGMNIFISASGSVNYNIMQGYGTMSIDSTSSAEHLHFIGDSSSNNNLIRDFDLTMEAVSPSYGGHLDFIHSTNTGNIESLGNKIAITTPSGLAGSYGQAYHLAGSGGGHIHSTSNNIEVVGFGDDYIGNINATETLYSHFDDIVAEDNINGDGTYSYVNSPSNGDLQMSGNIIKKLINITADYDETESWEFGILSANSSTIDITATLNTAYFADVPSGATKTFVNAGTTKNFILDPNGATWGGSTQERVIYPGGYIILERVGGEGIIIASHNTSFNIDIDSIDNPSFHVDFSDASSVTTDGSNHITQVVDSVNSWNGTPSSVTGVNYLTASQNGLSTAQWDTNNTPLSFGDNDINSNTAGRGMTIIAVVKADNTGDAIMSKYYDATPQREWRFYTNNITIYSNLDSSGNEATVNYSSNYGEWQILQIEWVPGERATAYKNGFLMGTSSYDVATIPSGTADLLIGASDLVGADFMGEIGEVWAFSDTLTADERASVTSKLGAKWDIDTATPSSSDSSPFGRNSDTETIKPLIDNDNLDIGTGVFDGIIGDGTELETSAAPTTDAGIANKKYVDDNGGGGLTWGDSITDTSGVGVTTTIGNSADAGTIGQSIVIGGTQTDSLTGLNINTGTSTAPISALTIVAKNSPYNSYYKRGGVNINSFSSATQANVSTHNFTDSVLLGYNYNTKDNSYSRLLFIQNENNSYGITRYNTGIYLRNKETKTNPYTIDAINNISTGYGIFVEQRGTAGSAIGVYGKSNLNSSTSGLVNYTLSNTQSSVTVMQKIDLGTSAQGHTGLLINAKGASSSQKGIKVDMGTSGTGVAYYASASVNGGAGSALFKGLLGGNYDGYGIKIDEVLGGEGESHYEVMKDSGNPGAAVLSNITATWASSALVNRSIDTNNMAVSRANTGAYAKSDNYNLLKLKRTSIMNNAGGSLAGAGSVLAIENVATQTSGTLTDSVAVLKLTQDNDSTGGHILMNAYSGTPTTDGTFYFDGSDFKARIGGTTYTFTKT